MSDTPTEKLKALRYLCECSNQRLYVEIIDEVLAQQRVGVEELREGIERLRKLWIAAAFPANVAQAGEIYDAIDRELAALSALPNSPEGGK
jgi:hypothetical protein